MNNDTFGDSKKYKMLVYLTKLISNLDDNRKKYISKFIHNFNSIINQTNNLNLEYKAYVLELIRKDYRLKSIELIDKYDSILITYLNNYITAKIRNNREI